MVLDEELENDEVGGGGADLPMSDAGEQGNGGGAVSNAAQKGVEQASKKTKEKLTKKAMSAIKSGAAKQSVLAALGPILLYAFVIIVILIIVIGIAMFLVTMPGMVMDQLKAIVKELGNYVAAFFGADTTEQIDAVEVYQTLDYLEQMGYDLKGEGFLSGFYKDESDLTSDEKKELDKLDSGWEIDEKVGVVRNPDDDSIVLAKTDFIFTYIMSDNYVYTLKNDNIVTQKDDSSFLAKIATGIATAWYKIRNFMFSPLFDALGITDGVVDTWGKGLIVVYYDHDGKSGVGRIKEIVNDGTLFNWDTIKINPESKTLSIKRKSLFNNNNAMEFSLDGWTGRYGMPLEFLLSVHKATLMPDLAADMVTSFPTEIQLLLHKTSGEAIGGYKSNGKYIDWPQISEAITGLEGRNFFSSLLADFVNWLRSDNAKVEAAREIGIDVGNNDIEGCTCTFEKGGAASCGCVVKFNWTPFVWRYEYTVTVDEEGHKHKKGDASGAPTEEVDVVDVACERCKGIVNGIWKYLGGENDYHFNAYTPYIASVQDHWYRDVYFVINKNSGDTNYTGNQEFVDYDYDYEILTGERWTLYETDDDGNFVYYEIDEEGEYKRDGSGNPIKYEGKVVEGEVEIVKGEESQSMRIANMGEDGTKVAKKAVTIKSSDTETMSDLGWNKNSTNVWSAYEMQDTTSGYEALYTQEDIDGEDNEYYKEVMKNSFINLNLQGNIVQVGEGQRTETNSTIKKMFMINNYFRYDGTDSTAEIITALRDAVHDSRGSKAPKYGKIEDDELDITATVKIAGEENTYKVSDYVGNVVLNQDSLNAFTMLENTHTLDADYIYRDFKELVVELGYFTKEELTDETPKLLQWVIPDTGSGGYPDRTLDKRENEFGTMIHSKSDIDVNKKHTLVALLQQMAEETPLEGSNEFSTEPGRGLGERMGSGRNISITEVGAIDGEVKKVEQVSIDELLTATREMCEYMNAEGYDYCVYATDAGDGKQFCHHAPVHNNGCFLAQTFPKSQESVSKHNVCCATLVSWALQNVGVMPDSAHQNGANSLANWIQDNLNPEIIQVGEPLKPGDILCYDGHIDMVGEEVSGGYVKYNGGAYVKIGATEFGDHSCIQKISGWPSDSRLKFALRLNWGGSSDPNPYVGYLGNEAVVSPVTGILLDYGTYEKVEIEEGDNTTEDPRVNVDLKYGFPNIYENFSDEEGTETPFESQIVSDKVGYAKILVLDAENYQKLEANTSNSWKSDSLVKIDAINATTSTGDRIKSNKVTFVEALNGETDKEKYSEEYEDWSMLDKTIYGYKEFAETYEKYGIAGYVVYIDGFKCELPDESLNSEDGNNDDVPTKIPNGEKLTINSFKISETNLESDDVIESKYESDEERKLASEKSTNKLNAEIDLKTQAASSIYADNLIFIKEGTIIGRTLTDKELVDGSDFRNGEYGTYEELRGDNGSSEDDDEDDDLKLIGNYVRVILKDEDGTTVENVEDYMKLDEQKAADNDWELFFWLPFESGGTDIDGCGPESQGTCSEGETAVGIIQWTVLLSSNMNNIGSQFIPGCLEEDSSLCSPLAAYTSWSASDFWNDYKGSKQFQATLSSICDVDRDGFLHVQMEVAKKQYLQPLLEKYPWLEKRPSCVQGAVMHLKVWGASTEWLSSYAGSSDEEIVLKVRNTIANTGSTAGPASGDETRGRAYNEPQIALEILKGAMSADDVEQWVRTKDVSYLSFDWKG